MAQLRGARRCTPCRGLSRGRIPGSDAGREHRPADLAAPHGRLARPGRVLGLHRCAQESSAPLAGAHTRPATRPGRQCSSRHRLSSTGSAGECSPRRKTGGWSRSRVIRSTRQALVRRTSSPRPRCCRSTIRPARALRSRAERRGAGPRSSAILPCCAMTWLRAAAGGYACSCLRSPRRRSIVWPVLCVRVCQRRLGTFMHRSRSIIAAPAPSRRSDGRSTSSTTSPGPTRSSPSAVISSRPNPATSATPRTTRLGAGSPAARCRTWSLPKAAQASSAPAPTSASRYARATCRRSHMRLRRRLPAGHRRPMLIRRWRASRRGSRGPVRGLLSRSDASSRRRSMPPRMP